MSESSDATVSPETLRVRATIPTPGVVTSSDDEDAADDAQVVPIEPATLTLTGNDVATGRDEGVVSDVTPQLQRPVSLSGVSGSASFASGDLTVEATATVTPPTLSPGARADLVAVVPRQLMIQIEPIITMLDRALLELADTRHELAEVQAERDTLLAQLHSPKPKRQAVSGALLVVGGWAAGMGNNMLANAAYDVLKNLLGVEA